MDEHPEAGFAPPGHPLVAGFPYCGFAFPHPIVSLAQPGGADKRHARLL